MRTPTYGSIYTEEVNKLLKSGVPDAKGNVISKAIQNALGEDRKDKETFARQLIILQRAFKARNLPTDFDKIRTWMQKQDPNDLYTLIKQINNHYQIKGTRFIAVIRGFCGHNTIPLPKWDLKQMRNHHDGPDKPEALKWYGSIQNKRHKLIFLLQAESGIAIHTILNLKNKDLQTNKHPNYTFINLPAEAYTGKHPEGITFLSPNAQEIYNELLQEPKHNIGRQPEENIFPFKYTTIRGVFHRALPKGLTYQPTHGLVKYYANRLKEAGITGETLNIMTGHSNKVMDYYLDRHKTDEIRNHYIKAYPFVNIYSPTGPALATSIGETDRKMQELTKEVEAFRKTQNDMLIWLSTITGKTTAEIKQITEEAGKQLTRDTPLSEIAKVAETTYAKLKRKDKNTAKEPTA